MSQGKSRTSAVALLTVAGGLLAAAPVLITPDEASAAAQKSEGAIILQRNKTKGERGIIINYKRPRPK
jgi:hypothetical protein